MRLLSVKPHIHAIMRCLIFHPDGAKKERSETKTAKLSYTLNILYDWYIILDGEDVFYCDTLKRTFASTFTIWHEYFVC